MAHTRSISKGRDMDRLNYAGESILTGTAISAAVLELAQALATADASETIEIPTREEDGSLGVSHLLIGPASQLIASAEDTDLPEVEDPHLVERLRARTVALRGPRATPIDESDFPEDNGYHGV